ncbi:hypothetical protein HanIR_Chr16g0822451 [Helianthus annuus]|nr:hypothetical protein HanIR_Chr16g0822451 [Helianthus annuus]
MDCSFLHLKEIARRPTSDTGPSSYSWASTEIYEAREDLYMYLLLLEVLHHKLNQVPRQRYIQ